MLTDIDWKNYYDTSQHDLVRDFFEPALNRSARYDRGVGYFSSAWIRENSKGLYQFAANGGRARWITSPMLSEKDWQAMRLGDEGRTDEIVRSRILLDIDDLERSLADNTLSALAWMVADQVITFRFAIPRNKLDDGEFHDKFGVFTDASGRSLSFGGSYNDSAQGLRNYESIKVFCDWLDPFREFVINDTRRFERIWNNEDPNLKVYAIDELAKAKLLKLRKGDRPYRTPSGETEAVEPSALDSCPLRVPLAFELREYQKDAIRKWFENQCRGILEMCTGSGKTLTAIYAASKLFERARPLVIVIICPYINLANQWIKDLQAFRVDPIRCYEERARWEDRVLTGYQSMSYGREELMVLLTTNKTFASDAFQRSLKCGRFRHLIIADEVHNLGAEKLSHVLRDDAEFRLGLSATPQRHFDEDGTRRIFDHFGGSICRYTLNDAIRDKILTPYEYHPVLIDLNETEAEKYWEITAKLSKFWNLRDDKLEMNEVVKMLLLARSRLIASAENKLLVLKETALSLPRAMEQALVYCGDGQVECPTDETMERQVTAVTRMLGLECGLKVCRFTCEEPVAERDRMIADLKEGRIHAVVAIRCLDEGIDIPAARMAFILASSTNPRQYIQRRGRILRRAEGKSCATIYDFIVRPPDYGGEESDTSFEVERKLFQRELRRIIEFCDGAQNGVTALNSLKDLRMKYRSLGGSDD